MKKQMRRLAALSVLLCLVLSLCGCAGADSTEKEDYDRYDVPFKLTADFTRGSLCGSFAYTRSSPGQCALEYLSPENLSGMKVRNESGVIKTEHLGITSEQERASLKSGNPIRALSLAFEAFKAETPAGKALASGETEYTLANGVHIVSYCGQLRRVECPADELIITITGFEYLE